MAGVCSCSVRHACPKSYIRAIPGKITPTKWLELHSDLYALVLPKAAVSRVMALADDEPLSKVADDLKAIWESSSLGMRLFGWACHNVWRRGPEKVHRHRGVEAEGDR